MANESDLEAGLLHSVEPLPLSEVPSNSQYNASSDGGSSIFKGTNTLGLSQHSPVWYLTRIQKYSSWVFTAFAAAHITNTSLIPLITRNVPASESYLLLTRPYYQGIPAEPLLIVVPMWTHIISGVALRFYRRNQNARRFGEISSSENNKNFFVKFWPSVSGVSKLGFTFVPLLLGHMFINRAIPNQFPGGPSNINLSYVSHAFAKHPAISYAGFAALLSTGCFHITWGWAKWLGYTPDQVTEMGAERQLVRKRRWYIVNALAATVTVLWMAGSFGVLAHGGEAPGWVGRMYDDMYRMIPLVGKWM